MRALNPTEVEKTVVNLTDGSVWEAEYGSSGWVLTREISSPPAPTPPPTYVDFKSPPPKPTPPRPEGIIIMPIDYPTEPEPEEPEETKPPEVMEDSVFRARLANIMTDNMYDRKVRRRTRGRVDMTSLWKAEAGATNLFTQKQARKNKEYNIVLLIDESGSMRGDNIKAAASTATFLAKTFTGLNLNLAIIGFNAFVAVHKDFDEKLPNLPLLESAIIDIAGRGSMGSGHNNDYEALSYAYRLFGGRKGQNFLIMLSDGDPAASVYVDSVLKNPKALQKALEDKGSWAYSAIDKMGKTHSMWVDTDSKLSFDDRHRKPAFHSLVHQHPDVASIGIGLETDCWQIPTHIREDDMDRLKPVLLREIQKVVRRG
jgi:uncharacterized protein YegL